MHKVTDVFLLHDSEKAESLQKMEGQNLYAQLHKLSATEVKLIFV
jgi:hypothetical protein